MEEEARYHAIVSKERKEGVFPTIQAALDAAPKGESLYRIFVHAGEYHERIEIERPNIEIVGKSAEETVIWADVCAGMLEKGGQLVSTLGSRVVEINSVDVTLKHLSIINRWDFIGNVCKQDDDPTKIRHSQAVALLLNRNSNRVYLEHVMLQSYQDTFCTQGGQSHLKQCRISGNIDFVFGCGESLLEECDLICRAWPSRDKAWGYVAAPSTHINDDRGLTFLRCRVIKESDHIPDNSYALGRPWHPTKEFADGLYADPEAIGKAAFIECFLDGHIYGWDKMHGRAPDGTQTYFQPDKDARFYEKDNHGPGASHGGFRAE